MDVRNPDAAEYLGNGNKSAAVQGRVDGVKLFAVLPEIFGVHQKRHGALVILLIDLAADDSEKVGGECRRISHGLDLEIIKAANAVEYSVRPVGSALTAVRPVDLVAVVFGRIVACGNYDAGYAVEMAHGE